MRWCEDSVGMCIMILMRGSGRRPDGLPSSPLHSIIKDEPNFLYCLFFLSTVIIEGRNWSWIESENLVLIPM
jgi:hypothetical protein